jgi:cellulose synthase (UDP-forming)
LRRAALDDVGGIAHESVTEDAHTSLRMQMKAWSTAYVNIPQAAGLATVRLSAHVRQRIRWARGMVQILRLENPLFTPGLTFAQRLCYFNAMCHFLYPVPRLIFLTAPLIFLLFNHTNIPGYWAAIVAYALPHLVLSVMTNSRIQGEHRYSFWNEVYETMLAPYILLPTVLALISPRLGAFNVTAKGGVVKRTYFDSKIALPFLTMLLFNFAGLVVAAPRLLMWDRGRPGTVMINVIWCLFNLIILGVCTAVARELKQLRTSVRISVVTPVVAELPDGRSLAGETIDMSSGGTRIRFGKTFQFAPGAKLRLRFPAPAAGCDVPATVVSSEGSVQRVRFENLSIAWAESSSFRCAEWVRPSKACSPEKTETGPARIRSRLRERQSWLLWQSRS